MRCNMQQAAMAFAVMAGAIALPAAAQSQRYEGADKGRGRSSRPAPPPAAPPRDSRVGLPQDSRVPLPSDSRAPLGTGRLRDTPSAAERARQQPVERFRDPRPVQQRPQGTQSAIEHARELEADARRRHGLPARPGSGNSDPGTTPRPVPPRYYDYWVYDGFTYGNQPPHRDWRDRRRGWADGGGPVGLDVDEARDALDRRRRNVDARDPGHRAADRRRGQQVPDGAPQLPPDELLGDEGMSDALKKALDGSPEWKQAAADLMRAWGGYAEAVERVLGELGDRPEYRRAQAALRQAKAKLEAVQAPARAPAGQGRAVRPDAGADRLLAAAEAALKARRAVRGLETAALSADPAVQRAEARLDETIDRRNEIRDKVAATLPPADRPAQPKRPKLLEDE